MQTPLQHRLLVGVALLLAIVASRLFHLYSFPPFIDEGVHIAYSETIRNSGPLALASEGRQLYYWWLIALQTAAAAPIWMVRAATILSALPGAAAVFALGGNLAGRKGALAAGLFYLFSPYHLFFERLGLSDALSASAVLVGVALAFRLARELQMRDAVWQGTALATAVFAKISALPYLAIPIAAYLTLRRRNGQRRWLRAQGLAIAIALGLTGGWLLLLFWRGYNQFFYLQTGPGADASPVSFVLPNLIDAWATFTGYEGLPLALVCAVGALFLVLRRKWFVPLVLVAPLIVLSLSARQASRHLIVPISLLLTCGGAALALVIRERGRAIQWAAFGLIGIWAVAQSVPFWWVLTHDPAQTALPDADRAEYMLSDASGFGIYEVTTQLAALASRRVIGILPNCPSLRAWAWDRFAVECPRLNPNGEDIPALTTLMETSRAEGVYVVLEDSAYAPTDAPGRLIGLVRTAVDRPPIRLYDLAP